MSRSCSSWRSPPRATGYSGRRLPPRALRLAEKDLPGLALLDIVLAEGGDGVAVARALRDRHGTPSLFLSAQTLQARAAKDAAWGLIRKPYDPVVVVRAVEGVGEIILGRRPGSLPRELELFREV